MSRLDHGRVMEVLAGAMELSPSQRTSYLDLTCYGEPHLRREVEDLLECAGPAAEAFEAASEQLVHADPEQIGPYSILEPIGEGGMAIVYRAQQREPVRRTVALKLIKLGMDTRQFVARFEAERQALATMDHPNVARVYDAGSTDTGRPFFVMEYVEGRTVLDYCDEHRLSMRERLELFAVVCDAVEHAHRKGIIHRDIKNTNVLVTEVDGKPVPKVIDFGVAKAIQQPLTERTLHTEHGQLIGTPEYMSPEQAERGALDVDTRTDVYSLGVLLYELIAGVQPIPAAVLRGAGYEQVQRIIRHTDMPRPSTRLSTLGDAAAARIAQCRQIALPALIRDLRSELEWIPLKAMRKDREQRYRSAAELADDARNYLAHRPLIAAPESATYKLRKLLRRHKAGVAASATVVFVLVAGVVATGWQAVRATRAEQRALQQKQVAERNNEVAESVMRFLFHDVLAGATPDRLPDKAVRGTIVRAMLDPAALVVSQRFADQPLIQARVQQVLGMSYQALGQTEAALALVRGALDLHRAHLGEDDPETLTSLSQVARALCELGRFDEAEAMSRQALDGGRRVLGADDPQTLVYKRQLAWVLEAQGRLAEAEPLCRDALQRQRRVLGNDHRETVESISMMSILLRGLGRIDEAESLAREALERRRRALGDEDTATLSAAGHLARLLQDQGRMAEAEPLCRHALEGRRRVLGDDHRDTLGSIVDLAGVLQAQGKLADGEALCREALDRCRRALGADHRDTISYGNNLAVILMKQRKYVDAEPLCRDAVERSRRVWGADHPNTISCVNNLAHVLERQGKFAEAEVFYREALERLRVQGNGHPEQLATMHNLGRMLAGQGRDAEAEPVLGELHRRAVASQGDPRLVALAHSYYGPCLARLGRYAEAERPLREAHERLAAAGLGSDPRMAAVLAALVDVCEHGGRADEAAAWRAALNRLGPSTRPATNPA